MYQTPIQISIPRRKSWASCSGVLVSRLRFKLTHFVKCNCKRACARDDLYNCCTFAVAAGVVDGWSRYRRRCPVPPSDPVDVIVQFVLHESTDLRIFEAAKLRRLSYHDIIQNQLLPLGNLIKRRPIILY